MDYICKCVISIPRSTTVCTAKKILKTAEGQNNPFFNGRKIEILTYSSLNLCTQVQDFKFHDKRWRRVGVIVKQKTHIDEMPNAKVKNFASIGQ